ncbi:MAG: FMN-binding protein [Gorillibacterium sp.]|nr:FMN-binding protein [Gorillibacterium sp.]
MRKALAIVVSMIWFAGLLVGCGGKEEAAAKYTDGVYYAQGDNFDEKTGWKETVALKVESDKITSVNWNALNKSGGLDKKETSKQGLYGMKASGASSEWHEQAALAEAFLIEKQDPALIVLNDEGKTDAIAGVSVHINGLTTLAAKALAAGPVKAGAYKDGTYYAEGKAFDAKTGWKENATVTVVNGKIFAVQWNSTNKDGGTDKVTRSKSGEYGMKASGASSEWHEQAALAEQALLEQQDPAAIAVKEDGKTDAISGVSIHVGEFFTLVLEALGQAK